MKRLIAIGISAALVGCATQKGNERHAQHAADQVRMVAVQREARVKEQQAEAEANVKLYESLARVAEANPDHAPAVTVALAVIGVRGADADQQDAPTVTLQAQEDTALRYVEALAPTVGGLVTGLGIAAINADVAKTQSRVSRDIQMNQDNTNARIVESVAAVGLANAENPSLQVGGDYYSATDSAVISQDTNQTTTTTNTTTTTESTAISLSTALTYEGSGMSLADLIAQLRNAGASYSISFDGVEVASGDGDGETIVIDCTKPQFSPAPPECSI